MVDEHSEPAVNFLASKDLPAPITMWTNSTAEACAVLHADGTWRCEVPVQPKEVRLMECPADFGIWYFACGLGTGMIITGLIIMAIVVFTTRRKS